MSNELSLQPDSGKQKERIAGAFAVKEDQTETYSSGESRRREKDQSSRRGTGTNQDVSAHVPEVRLEGVVRQGGCNSVSQTKVRSAAASRPLKAGGKGVPLPIFRRKEQQQRDSNPDDDPITQFEAFFPSSEVKKRGSTPDTEKKPKKRMKRSQTTFDLPSLISPNANVSSRHVLVEQLPDMLRGAEGFKADGEFGEQMVINPDLNHVTFLMPQDDPNDPTKKNKEWQRARGGCYSTSSMFGSFLDWKWDRPGEPKKDRTIVWLWKTVLDKFYKIREDMDKQGQANCAWGNKYEPIAIEHLLRMAPGMVYVDLGFITDGKGWGASPDGLVFEFDSTGTLARVFAAECKCPARCNTKCGEFPCTNLKCKRPHPCPADYYIPQCMMHAFYLRLKRTMYFSYGSNGKTGLPTMKKHWVDFNQKIFQDYERFIGSVREFKEAVVKHCPSTERPPPEDEVKAALQRPEVEEAYRWALFWMDRVRSSTTKYKNHCKNREYNPIRNGRVPPEDKVRETIRRFFSSTLSGYDKLPSIVRRVGETPGEFALSRVGLGRDPPKIVRNTKVFDKQGSGWITPRFWLKGISNSSYGPSRISVKPCFKSERDREEHEKWNIASNGVFGQGLDYIFWDTTFVGFGSFAKKITGPKLRLFYDDPTEAGWQPLPYPHTPPNLPECIVRLWIDTIKSDEKSSHGLSATVRALIVSGRSSK